MVLVIPHVDQSAVWVFAGEYVTPIPDVEGLTDDLKVELLTVRGAAF